MAKAKRSGPQGTGVKQPLTALRNPLHNHPLLSKGAVHDKSTKAKRRNDKLNIHRELKRDSGHDLGRDGQGRGGKNRDHFSACA